MFLLLVWLTFKILAIFQGVAVKQTTDGEVEERTYVDGKIQVIPKFDWQ